jgi:hypothetical protein
MMNFGKMATATRPDVALTGPLRGTGRRPARCFDVNRGGGGPVRRSWPGTSARSVLRKDAQAVHPPRNATSETTLQDGETK